MDEALEEKIRRFTEIAEQYPEKVGRVGWGLDGYQLILKNVNGTWGLYKDDTFEKSPLSKKELNTPVKIFGNTEEAIRFALTNLQRGDIAASAKKKLKRIAEMDKVSDILNVMVDVADQLDEIGLIKEADAITGMMNKISRTEENSDLNIL